MDYLVDDEKDWSPTLQYASVMVDGNRQIASTKSKGAHYKNEFTVVAILPLSPLKMQGGRILENLFPTAGGALITTEACAPGPPMDERPDDDQPEEDSGLIPQIDRPMSMPYLCCKLWRWKRSPVTICNALRPTQTAAAARGVKVFVGIVNVSCVKRYEAVRGRAPQQRHHPREC
ncbi:hypothetical protein COOONC_03049 [Cooperia oncophora]